MTHRIRNGRNIKTIIETTYSTSIFHEVDNLDSKTPEQAENNYEEVFIRIRNILTGQSWSCQNQKDVLTISQKISDELRKNSLLRKDTK